MKKTLSLLMLLVFVCVQASYQQLNLLKNKIKKIQNQLEKDELTKKQADAKIQKIKKLLQKQNLTSQKLKQQYNLVEQKLNELNSIVKTEESLLKKHQNYQVKAKNNYLTSLFANNYLKTQYYLKVLKNNSQKTSSLQKQHLQFLCQNIENEKLIQDIDENAKKLNQTQKKQKKQLTKLNKKVKTISSLQKARLDSLNTYKKQAKKLAKLMQKLALQQKQKIGNFGSCTLPAKGKIAKFYGESKKGRLKSFSNGIDLILKTPYKIKAVKNGIVAFASYFNGFGRLVIVDHENGWFSLYANNTRLKVSKGDKVKMGQVIAIYDKTDKNFHFELRKGSKSVDPLPFLQELLND